MLIINYFRKYGVEDELEDGEYGFSPDGSVEVFMFGVGELKQPK
jgi:hypothetical protein